MTECLSEQIRNVMKNIHQNVHQRIRKNITRQIYWDGRDILTYPLTSYPPAVSKRRFRSKKMLRQLSRLISRKKRSEKQRIISFIGENGFEFITHFIDLGSDSTQIVYSHKLLVEKASVYHNIACVQKFNVILNIDNFLQRVNNSLTQKGTLIGTIQTNQLRKENHRFKRVPLLGHVVEVLEFVFHRIFPKINGLKQLYFSITQGKAQHISKAEILGRIIKSGFQIKEIEENIDGLMYFVARKIKEPNVSAKASNGVIHKFPRVGKNGKIIGVYKVRTMHPYSEYLQDYMVKTYGYASNGKLANDFRIPKWAKFVRRYWLDELPQLINVAKGEMKIFGARPVTKRYFQDIPENIQKLRLSQKPGCIPPYVAFNRPSSKESVLSAEENYLRLKKKGVFVDLKLAFVAVKNIVFKGKRGA